MVVAELDQSRITELRDLLATMNLKPGQADPHNSLIPFEELENLHFARLVVLDDQTTGDVEAYGLPPVRYPLSLAFLGDFDGDYDRFLTDLAACAGPGLRRIFSYCADFTAASNAELIRWMKLREYRPATYYCNWRGRTVRQTREEESLRRALVRYVRRTPELAGMPAPAIAAKLREFVNQAKAEGQIRLTPEPPTPWIWRIRNALHAALAAPAIVLVGIPVGIMLLALLRAREKSDPEIAPRPEPAQAAALARIEDHDVTNQFTAMGTLKPGAFRRWSLTFILWLIQYTTRHIYVRGRLARVRSIHFARWVFIDGKKRLVFFSNYDGSLESYMDDFINKVAFGLNVVFTHGIGYPTTRGLLLDGAKDEQKFKYYIRRHELATEVWYNAHAGLTAANLEQNSRIRRGIESPGMGAEETRQWVELL
jgi:hypothetical protein